MFNTKQQSRDKSVEGWCICAGDCEGILPPISFTNGHTVCYSWLESVLETGIDWHAGSYRPCG